MARKENHVTRIAQLTSKRFPSLSVSEGVEELVRFVLAKQNALEREWFKKNIGDDARDYANTSYFLRTLTNKALGEISHLGRGDIQRHLREKTYPFNSLNKKTRETLLDLPNSWIHGAADWLLSSRKTKRVRQQVRI